MRCNQLFVFSLVLAFYSCLFSPPSFGASVGHSVACSPLSAYAGT
jgi:hypothetical protein